MSSMNPGFRTSKNEILNTCTKFWHRYYESMRQLHVRMQRKRTEPLKDRNLGTTDARHVNVFEDFWRDQLAKAIGVSVGDVASRTISFRAYRSKNFDVCWPLEGDPRILISIKTMQNAYRNLTNRIEEALGDSAVLRLYGCNAVFGFFFFMLDGNVARGIAEQGRVGEADRTVGRGRGVAPFLDLIEEGGDFFSLGRVKEYRKLGTERPSKRQDVIAKAEQSLLDLAAEEPREVGGIHYDAVAFLPTQIRRLVPNPEDEKAWKLSFSNVNARFGYREFIGQLIEVAKLRGFL